MHGARCKMTNNWVKLCHIRFMASKLTKLMFSYINYGHAAVGWATITAADQCGRGGSGQLAAARQS